MAKWDLHPNQFPYLTWVDRDSNELHHAPDLSDPNSPSINYEGCDADRVCFWPCEQLGAAQLEDNVAQRSGNVAISRIEPLTPDPNEDCVRIAYNSTNGAGQQVLAVVAVCTRKPGAAAGTLPFRATPIGLIRDDSQLRAIFQPTFVETDRFESNNTRLGADDAMLFFYRMPTASVSTGAQPADVAYVSA